MSVLLNAFMAFALSHIRRVQLSVCIVTGCWQLELGWDMHSRCLVSPGIPVNHNYCYCYYYHYCCWLCVYPQLYVYCVQGMCCKQLQKGRLRLFWYIGMDLVFAASVLCVGITEQAASWQTCKCCQDPHMNTCSSTLSYDMCKKSHTNQRPTASARCTSRLSKCVFFS